MDKNITQLIDTHKLQKLFDTLYQSTGIPSSLIEPEGKLLTQSGWQEICLDFHRKNPQTREICRKSDRSIKERLKSGGIQVYQCPLGLIDCGCPVVVDGDHVATVFTGQFFHTALTEDDIERFRDQAQHYGFDEARYLDAVRQVPVIPPEKRDTILSFLSQLTEIIMEMVDQAKTIVNNERKYRLTFEAINDGLWQWDLQNHTMSLNSRCCEILGFSRKSYELKFEDFCLMIHPDDREMVVTSLMSAVEKKELFEQQFRIAGSNLSHIWMLGRGRVIEQEDRQGSHVMLGSFSDISESYRLKQSFERAFEHSPILMSLSDISTGRYIDVNRKFLEATGYERDHVIGAQSVDLGLIKAEDRTSLVRRLEVNGTIQDLRLHLRKASGEDLVCDYSGVAIDVDGQKLLLSLAVDVSHQLEAEQEKEDIARQLRQAQKMEAIGTLAGGIAHDFNNILSAMLGYTDMAMEDVDKESRVWRDLNNVLTAGSRAKELVGQILTFSRQTESAKTQVHTITVLKEVIKLLRSTLPSSINILQNFSIHEGTIYADPVQLHQIIMNLCTNAYHSIQNDRGTITISLKKCTKLPDRIARDALRENLQFIQLSVSDTGTGIDSSIMDRIFDPFFTTKEEGKGTGMGLSIAYGIIADLGGAITVESTVGQGSTFHLFLPETQAKLEGKNILSSSLPGGNETILVVDDEAPIVEMYTYLLGRLGYTVIGTTGATEALRKFTQSPESIDLVITDYTMPDLTGLELTEKLLGIRPELPIILCTGYSENIDEGEACRKGIRSFLYKPVPKRTIALTIRELLKPQSNEVDQPA